MFYLIGKILELSMQKFSSNVIEKLFKIGSKYIQDTMINMITDELALSSLITDRYGNYGKFHFYH
jgi:hypothetical protein